MAKKRERLYKKKYLSKEIYCFESLCTKKEKKSTFCAYERKGIKNMFMKIVFKKSTVILDVRQH